MAPGRALGRWLIDRTIAVGAKPECDVQVFGDDGVRPLQRFGRKAWRLCVRLLVVALPGRVVVADLQAPAVAIPAEDRLVLRLGHSSVTFGPPKKRLDGLGS